MKKVKFYKRKIAESARRFYLYNKTATFTDTALYITDIFKAKFTKHDISNMFKFIVVLGNNKKTAEELAFEINLRNKYSNPYSIFLSIRKDYIKNKIEISLIEKIFYEATLYQTLDFSYFEYSEDEEKINEYKSILQASYDKSKLIDTN